jgi:hypothetical protein
MTREELRQRFDAYYRAKRLAGVAFFAFLFLVCVITLVIAFHAPRGNMIAPLISFITLIAAVLLSLVGMNVISRRRSRARGLICPNCQKMLVGMPAPIAIASGHCCYCRYTLVTDA